MKTEEAIKINQEHAKEHDLNVDQSYFRALNLSNEALKAYQKAHDEGWIPPGVKLPGETTE